MVLTIHVKIYLDGFTYIKIRTRKNKKAKSKKAKSKKTKKRKTTKRKGKKTI
jgi:hypothetical protein